MSKKFLVSLSILSLLSVGQVQASIHPVGLAKSAVKGSVSLVTKGVSAVGGVLSRAVRVVHVTASGLLGNAHDSVNSLMDAADQGTQFILKGE